jgi:hypothetical protein
MAAAPGIVRGCCLGRQSPGAVRATEPVSSRALSVVTEPRVSLSGRRSW